MTEAEIQRYGQDWRIQRKIIHSALNIRRFKAYLPYQDLESKQMLRDILDSPEHYVQHLQRYSFSAMTQLALGFRTTSENDPRLQLIFKIIDAFGAVILDPNANLFDAFPLLRHLPSFVSSTKRRAKKAAKTNTECFVGHWNNTKQKYFNKSANVSRDQGPGGIPGGAAQ